MYWDLVPPSVHALDPGNCLILATGPLAGVAGLASSRCQVVCKSPAANPEQYSYCNFGGHWPHELKCAGYDGLVVEGAAERPTYLLITDHEVQLRDAAHLWGLSSVAARDAIKCELGRDVRVLAIGPAGENRVRIANILADNDASGSAGTGAVMGSKKLKAIAVRGTGKTRWAQSDRLGELIRYARGLTSHRPGANGGRFLDPSRYKKNACFGCIGCDNRAMYTAADGRRGKFMCQSSFFYVTRASRYYKQVTEVPFDATRLCDAYGLDTWAIETIIMWLSRCFQAGVLTDQSTGLPLSKLGSLEFIERLVIAIAQREGFGDILAGGLSRAAIAIGGRAPEMITDFMYSRSDQFTAYGPRQFIVSAIFLAMEPRHPIHQLHEMAAVALKWLDWVKGVPDSYLSGDTFRAIAERWWGSEDAADFSTYKGKALAAKMIQDRQFAKECLILCDFGWPITDSPNTADHMGDPTLESRILSAATGLDVDERGLYELGERALNVQRAVQAREGHRGRQADTLREVFFSTPLKTEFHNPECLMPGKDGEPFSKKGWVVDRQQFEQMKTEFYQYRGWDPATGLQTKAKLSDLGLDDIAEGLARCDALGDGDVVS